MSNITKLNRKKIIGKLNMLNYRTDLPELTFEGKKLISIHNRTTLH